MTGNQLPLLRTDIPGPQSRALSCQLHRFESRNVTFVSKNWPIFWKRAAGANVWDVDGNRYIDLSAAFGVAGVGHTNPRVVAAIRKQLATLLHAMGDLHPNELKLNLARELVELTFGRWWTTASSNHGSALHRSAATPAPARVLFASSGSEAVEAALKTAVIHTKRPGIIAFEGAYHGLTYGALDTTWRADFRTPFDKQLGHFTAHIPYGQVPLVGTDRRAVRNRRGAPGGRALPQPISHYGAVIVEPIQGRGGIVVPPDDFLIGLRHFCDEHGLVLIADEIYTGFCRTGRWFACEHWGVMPDIICVGKSMGGGFPIAACIGNNRVMDSWPESQGEAIHTSTFLGNPLGCAAALAAIKEMKRLRLPNRATELGSYMIQALGGPRSVVAAIAKRTRRSASLQIRGKGLMLGLEVGDAPSLCERLLKRGIIAIPEGNRGEVLGITPPLTITQQQLHYCVEVLTRMLQV